MEYGRGCLIRRGDFGFLSKDWFGLWKDGYGVSFKSGLLFIL